MFVATSTLKVSKDSPLGEQGGVIFVGQYELEHASALELLCEWLIQPSVAEYSSRILTSARARET
jgi:hypothetical protein